ncbi:hypothetical protein GCM10023116_46400 [Kistimonas scapharcae]|uniref:Uncharacterized protein n=1 Tax=Kistimonas scapharcae TaxID=1036133 RepID=A0ABP8VAF7_9GAMM
MNIREMLENHIEEMECQLIGLQDEIDTLKTKKETIHKEMIRLKTKLNNISDDSK